MSSEQGTISAHPDYPVEDSRLKSTIKAMREAVPELENVGYQVNPWDTEVDIRSKQMVAAYKHKKARALAQNLEVPYFGRVDYLEDGLYSPEELYIGRVGFNGAEEVQVVDWRAPKATVFYECQGGRTKYTVRDETYYGEVSLKRQYQINSGILENFFDDQVQSTLTAELPGSGVDQVLQRRLEQGTDNRLKDIVETIRAEQNKVIREPLEQVTIVQGTAGSGKSTVALHRVSYLLYNYKSLDAKKVVIIAPNKLFLDYISAVLPGLDLDEIKQFTLMDLAEEVLNSRLEIVEAAAEIKATNKLSLEFKSALEQLIKNLSDQFRNSLQDIVLYGGRLIIGREELVRKFQEGNNPLNLRLESLQKYLEFRINYFLETSDLYFDQKLPPGISKSMIKGYVQRVKDNYDMEMFKAGANKDRTARKVQYQQLKENLARDLAAIEAERTAFLQGFTASLPKQNLWEIYGGLLASVLGQEVLVSGQGSFPIAREDIAPLCLLKYHLDGFPFKYQHIVVDEAQDLSPIQFAVLKLLSRNSFTILGDLAQGINDVEGLSDWQILQEEVFEGQTVKYHQLNQSYRSTKEIVEFASRVIPPGLPRGIPVYRRGEEPKVEKSASTEETARRMAEQIEYYLGKGCKSIAVIAKTGSECAEVFPLLQQENLQELNLITEKSTTFSGGISLLPVALAKGLEFDAVIVWDASREKYSAEPRDAKQLFVALSRPLHYLHVFYTGQLSALLK